jgi:hypothetical protein
MFSATQKAFRTKKNKAAASRMDYKEAVALDIFMSSYDFISELCALSASAHPR